MRAECGNDELGARGPAVRDFIEGLRAIGWFVRVGREESWNGNVARVSSWDQATEVARASLGSRQAAWREVEEFAKRISRYDRLLKAEDCWIAADIEIPHDAWEAAWPIITSDIVGAVRETAISDLSDFHFFRDLMRWYELGHFPCGVDPSGGVVVF